MVELKYGTPFFYFKGKMFTYFWAHKKPYVGVIEGKHLMHKNPIQRNCTRIKIMMFDAD